MFGDMRDASSSFSYVTHRLLATGTVVSAVYDTGYVVSAATPTATLLLNFKAANAESNPHNIGPVTGSVSVAADMKNTMSASVADSKFYIRRMGGLSSSSTIGAGFADPLATDGLNSFQAPAGTTPSSAAADFNLVTQVWDDDRKKVSCSDAVTPFAACSGPWFTYAYVEVCPVNNFATRVPTQATPPTVLSTPAPSSPTPLIDLVFTSPTISPTIRAVFESAANFWNDVITNTHTPVALAAGTTNANSFGCGSSSNFVAGTTQIEGLTIFVSVGAIDGEGDVHAQAGTCAYSYSGESTTTFGDTMPRLGYMKFDIDDIQTMIDAGTLERVAMHELAHVLGFGLLWGHLHKQSPDARYVGANGIDGYKQLGGLSDDIPLSSTDDIAMHWRESTFEDELMTGAMDGDMTVSVMTIKALQDLGYVVDESKAETYSIDNGRKSDRGGSSGQFISEILNFGDKDMEFSG
jgi:hypothetical protein